MALSKDYNSIKWQNYFKYSEESPTGLVSLKTGKVVGFKQGSKGYRVRCCGSAWYVHRVIYYLIYGSIDSSLFIDHIDGNNMNNKKINLRLVTTEVNNRNKGVYKKSLKQGVTWLEVDGYLFAQARLGTKNRKCFLYSVTKLGIMEAWRQACIKRDQMFEENEYGERFKLRD